MARNEKSKVHRVGNSWRDPRLEKRRSLKSTFFLLMLALGKTQCSDSCGVISASCMPGAIGGVNLAVFAIVVLFLERVTVC